MKLLLKNNLVLYLLTGAFLIVGGLTIGLTEKDQLHLFFNSCVCAPLNSFFAWITHVGDGFFISGCLLIILFYNLRLFFAATCAYLLSSGVTQLLKHLVFKSEVRPFSFFTNNFPDTKLNLVEGIEMFGENSFPSGHTTAAFSLFFALGLFTSRHWLKAVYFFTALVIAFSRVYLSQHFFEDIYTGAIIGITCASLFFYIFYFSSRSGRFNRYDNTLLNFLSAPKSNA